MDDTARTDVGKLLSGFGATVTMPWDVWDTLLAGKKAEFGEECPTCGQVVKKRHASNADRQAAYREGMKARERVRPRLPDCWKCGSPHWPDEPCDDTPKAVKAIDKERKA